MTPVKGLKTPEARKKLAVEICGKIDASIIQRGSIDERWERLEAIFRNEPIPTGTEINGVIRNIPVSKPRLKQVIANICNPMFAVEPYFAARGYGAKGVHAKSCEKNVHFFNQRDQTDRRVKKAVKTAVNADPAFVKVWFEDGTNQTPMRETDTGGYVGTAMRVIHPKNMAIFPLYTGSILEASFVGHRFGMRVADIRQLQAEKVYYDAVTIHGGDDPQTWEAGRSKDWSLTEETSGILDAEDKAVEIWEGICKADLDGDGKEERYIVHIAKTDMVLLKCEPYGATVQTEDGLGGLFEEFIPYSRPWYFEISPTEPDDEELLRANPIGNDLQMIQLTSNELWSQFLDGSMMAATPAGFSNSPMLQQEVINYKPGTVYPVDDPQGINWVQVAFDGKNHEGLMQRLDRAADAAVSLTTAAQGQTSSGDTTATEVSALMQGQRTGLDDLRINVGACMAPIMDFKRELIWANWAAVEARYGDEIPVNNREVMAYGFAWEPMAKAGMNTPQEITLKIQNLMQGLQMLGVPMTPGVVAELVNVFFSTIDLPTDMEALKAEITQAFIMQVQSQQKDEGDQEAYQKGITDELSNGQGNNGAPRQQGMGAGGGMDEGAAAGLVGIPSFLRGG